MKANQTGLPASDERGFARPLILALLALIALAAITAIGGWLYAQNQYAGRGPETPDGADRIVMIQSGAGTGQIANRLAEAGAIESADDFRIAVRLTSNDGNLRAGEYAIPSGASIREIIDLLIEGRSLLYPITVPEGLTSAMIVAIVEQSEILTGDVPETIPAEGSLLPDTYMVHRGDTREAVLSRMAEAHDEVMEELWPERQEGLPFDTPEEAVILASIVEKETGLAEERPEVAAVFVNRLRIPMRLESDPTIIYGLTQGVPLGRGLRRSEIDRRTDYNTYQIDGLPPTPICNPGRASIAAVLDPPETDALFFVADGSGGHAFASTYSEHLRNVANWRRVEAQRAAQAGQ